MLYEKNKFTSDLVAHLLGLAQPIEAIEQINDVFLSCIELSVVILLIQDMS